MRWQFILIIYTCYNNKSHCKLSCRLIPIAWTGLIGHHIVADSNIGCKLEDANKPCMILTNQYALYQSNAMHCLPNRVHIWSTTNHGFQFSMNSMSNTLYKVPLVSSCSQLHILYMYTMYMYKHIKKIRKCRDDWLMKQASLETRVRDTVESGF